MKSYTYYFVDGTKNTIEIDDSWYEILKEMDEQERRQNYNYDRHNQSLSQACYEGESFADLDSDPFGALLRKTEREKIDSALTKLTDCQKELFEKTLIDGKKIAEIAAEQGVCHQAISARMSRLKNKLQKLLA